MPESGTGGCVKKKDCGVPIIRTEPPEIFTFIAEDTNRL
ncbi:MAG: hypothetical protein [Olavius algarvensis Gamma 3 endosymbiont]|nr:MAG: hypothetical protein [Olavius algarvensis Gamma 3 endosymbiont]